MLDFFTGIDVVYLRIYRYKYNDLILKDVLRIFPQPPKVKCGTVP